jgi:hypothetical protein
MMEDDIAGDLILFKFFSGAAADLILFKFFSRGRENMYSL